MADLWRRHQRPLIAALLLAIIAAVSVVTRFPGSTAVAGTCAVLATACLITIKYHVLRPQGADHLSTEHPPE